MKKRLVLSGSLLALLALTGFGAKRLHDSHGSLSEALRLGKNSDRAAAESREASRQRWLASRDEMLRRAKEWNARLVAERTDLQVHYRQVADADNGLLQLANLLNGIDPKDPDYASDEKIDAMRSTGSGWDSAIAAGWLKGKDTIIDKFEAIGRLPDRSAAGVDMNFLGSGARTLANVGLMIQARARLAMEAGDTETALNSMAALKGLAAHLQDNEAPTMLSAVVAAGMQPMVMDWMPDAALSAEEISRWRRLQSPAPQPDLATILRGDWAWAGPEVFLPAALGDRSQDFSEALGKNPDAVGMTMANLTAAEIRDLREKSLPEILAAIDAVPSGASFATYAIPANLPDDSRKAIEKVSGFNANLIKGLLIQRSNLALADAAAAVAMGEEPPADPVTGQPYRIDRDAGTILPPDVPFFKDAEARKIPVVKGS